MSLNVEYTLSWVVMNSSSTGLPSLVAAMPCINACITCDGLGDPLAVAAQGLGPVGVVSGNIGRVILLARHGHGLELHGHGVVVEQNGHDGNAARTAVSKSMPVMPIAASPHMLMHSWSGWASFAPMASPMP